MQQFEDVLISEEIAQVKYYQATQPRHLKVHKKSEHEGIKYLCDLCDYQTGRKYDLKKHIQAMHSLLELQKIR